MKSITYLKKNFILILLKNKIIVIITISYICIITIILLYTRDIRESKAAVMEKICKLSSTSLPRRTLDVLKLLSEPRLVEKIKGKLSERPLDVMESLATEINDVSTVCHGSFSRDNVLFGYENGKPCDVKVIDWQTMRYCSPAIDFGLILLANLPDYDQPSKVGLFCRDILRLYLDAVAHECPGMARELLERDIVAKLPFAYIVLCMDGNVTDGELATMLRVLDDLGTFD